MDLREYVNDPEEMMRTFFDGFMKGVWTAMPVIVQKDSDGKTVSLKMAIKGIITKPDGKKEKVEYPQLDDVPVHFVGGGGFTFTHKIAKGDEGLVIFTSRSLDSWFENGGVQDSIDGRHHNLADAKFIPGYRSKKRELKKISTSTAQIRSDDGDHVFDFDHAKGKFTMSVDKAKHTLTVFKGDSKSNKPPSIVASIDNGKHSITIDKNNGITHKSSVKVKIDAPKIEHSGDLKVTGSVLVQKVIQSLIGLKGPLIGGLPGDPGDANKF